MAAVTEIRKDYNKIATLAIKLLFAEPFSLQTSAMDTPYISCEHPYPPLLDNPPELTPERRARGIQWRVFTISDTIYGTFTMPIEDYNNIIGGQFGFHVPYVPALTQLYVNYNGTGNERLITDFLFHCYYNSKPDTAAFIPEMKKAALRVAKIIIAEELNANLVGIRLIYDAESMKPSWKIDNLLCSCIPFRFLSQPRLGAYAAVRKSEIQ